MMNSQRSDAEKNDLIEEGKKVCINEVSAVKLLIIVDMYKMK